MQETIQNWSKNICRTWFNNSCFVMICLPVVRKYCTVSISWDYQMWHSDSRKHAVNHISIAVMKCIKGNTTGKCRLQMMMNWICACEDPSLELFKPSSHYHCVILTWKIIRHDKLPPYFMYSIKKHSPVEKSFWDRVNLDMFWNVYY